MVASELKVAWDITPTWGQCLLERKKQGQGGCALLHILHLVWRQLSLESGLCSFPLVSHKFTALWKATLVPKTPCLPLCVSYRPLPFVFFCATPGRWSSCHIYVSCAVFLCTGHPTQWSPDTGSQWPFWAQIVKNLATWPLNNAIIKNSILKHIPWWATCPVPPVTSRTEGDPVAVLS